MMGMKWVPYVAVSLVILLFYLANFPRVKDDLTDRSIVKLPGSNGKTTIKANENSEAKIKSIAAPKKSSANLRFPTSETSGRDEHLDPSTNPFLIEKRKRTQGSKIMFTSIEAEKREPIDLQIVGNGTWSLFSDLQVSRDPEPHSLFKMGPYHVSRKDESGSGKVMGLILEENQKQLGVLTGRLVLKVRDLYDVDPIVRDYGLKIDTVSAEIRTAYLDASHIGGFAKLNATLKGDQRIERFYFEVVKTEWIRN
jgi:biopolymer transport protein ExbD